MIIINALVIFVFISSTASAGYLDSLERSINPLVLDTQQVDLLNELCWEYQFIDYDKAMAYGLNAFEKAKVLDYKKGIADAHMLIGMIHDDKAEYQKALQRYRMALIIRTNFDSPKGIASAYNNIGTVYYKMGRYSIALENYNKAMEEWTKANDKNGLASTYINVGLVYIDQGRSENALDFLTRSLKVYEELEDKDGYANSLIKIAGIYSNLGNYDMAFNYCNQALVIFEETGNQRGRASTFNDIGILYRYFENYDKSIEYLRKSLELRNELGDISGISASMNNLGYTYFIINDYNKALEYYSSAVDIFKRIGCKQDASITLGNIGDIYRNRKNPAMALRYYMESLDISEEIGFREKIRDNYGRIAEAYAQLGNYVKAYDYHTLFFQLNDSLYNAQRARNLAEMQTFFDTERKEKTIELLKKDKELLVKDGKVRDLQLRQTRIVIFAVLIGFALMLFFSVMLFRANKKKKQVLDLLRIHNAEIIRKNTEIQAQRDLIEEKNKHITDSIKYAQRIQSAILPTKDTIKAIIPDNFVLYLPKDIVSGDFYWIEEKDNIQYIAAIDCTGHGVPGAFVSMIGYSLLNQALHEYNITKPSEILNYLSTGVYSSMKKTDDYSDVKVGMDIALCALDRVNMQLEFAGAFNPMYLVRDNEIEVVSADKMYIGELFNKEFKSFSKHVIKVQPDDIVYLFSDGFIDQLGGNSRKRYLSKNFRSKLLSIKDVPLPKQAELLEREMIKWRGRIEQIDDILIIGFKI